MAPIVDKFLGQHIFNLDNKGRVSIPAEFREVLSEFYDEKIVLMKTFDRCLAAYPVDEWRKLDEKIRKLPSSDPKVTKYIRMFYSSAKPCELDGQGRILVPQPLKTYAGLSREVAIIGMSNRMELWDLNTWNDLIPEEDGADLQVAMAEYGL